MEDKLNRLKELLDNENYPLLYLFKFIIKHDHSKVVEIKRCFDETAEFNTQLSKEGNYISVSIKAMMLTSDEIIEKYKLVGKIKNVITL